MGKQRIAQVAAPLGSGTGILTDGRLVTGVTGHGRALSLSDGRVAMPGGAWSGRASRHETGNIEAAARWGVGNSLNIERLAVALPAESAFFVKSQVVYTDYGTNNIDIISYAAPGDAVADSLDIVVGILYGDNVEVLGFFDDYELTAQRYAWIYPPRLYNTSYVETVYLTDNDTTTQEYFVSSPFFAMLARYAIDAEDYLTDQRIIYLRDVSPTAFLPGETIIEDETGAKGRVAQVYETPYAAVFVTPIYEVDPHIELSGTHGLTGLSSGATATGRWLDTTDFTKVFAATSDTFLYYQNGQWIREDHLYLTSVLGRNYAVIAQDVGTPYFCEGTFPVMWQVGFVNTARYRDAYGVNIYRPSHVYVVFLLYWTSDNVALTERLTILCRAYHVEIVDDVPTVRWEQAVDTVRTLAFASRDAVQAEIISNFGGTRLVTPITANASAMSIPDESLRPAFGDPPFTDEDPEDGHGGVWMAGGTLLETNTATSPDSYGLCLCHVSCPAVLGDRDALPDPIPYDEMP